MEVVVLVEVVVVDGREISYRFDECNRVHMYIYRVVAITRAQDVSIFFLFITNGIKKIKIKL